MRAFYALLLIQIFGWVCVPDAFAQSLGTVNFEFDSDRLDEEGKAQVAAIAEELIGTPSLKPVVFIGYADAIGSRSYNQALGQRRAERVGQEFLELGVPATRVGNISSRGERDLLVKVVTRSRANRRVVVSMGDIIAACPSYRTVAVNSSMIGDAMQNDLQTNLSAAITNYQLLAGNGRNSSAFQMAGAARASCERAIGLHDTSIRKIEYAQKCFCDHARMVTALGGHVRGNRLETKGAGR